MFTDTLPLADAVVGEMVRGRSFVDTPSMKGVVRYELSRGGRILVPETTVLNGITNIAKNQLLDAFFNNGTRWGPGWCISLVDSSTYSSFQPTDTISLHAGWTEFTAYTNSGGAVQRPGWGQGSAAGQAVTNPSPAVFNFTGNGTIQGIFITPDNTVGGNSYTLWSTAGFAAPLAVQSGDQLRVTYTVQL